MTTDTSIHTGPERRPKLGRRLVVRLDQAFYPDYVLRFDDAVCRDLILSHLDPGKSILDLGAGAGIHAHTGFRGHAARVCGIDPDPRVVENPALDEGRVADARAIPYENESFDVVFAWNVLEHLDDPARVFAEAARVLKPGGVFIAKTPNRWHYVALVARLTPHRLHQWIVSRLLGWRHPDDVFPTLYRANAPGVLRRLAVASGLRVIEIRGLETRPEYLRFSPLVYPFGIAYERAVNSWSGFQRLRTILIAVFEKPAA